MGAAGAERAVVPGAERGFLVREPDLRALRSAGRQLPVLCLSPSCFPRRLASSRACLVSPRSFFLSFRPIPRPAVAPRPPQGSRLCPCLPASAHLASEAASCRPGKAVSLLRLSPRLFSVPVELVTGPKDLRSGDGRRGARSGLGAHRCNKKTNRMS